MSDPKEAATGSDGPPDFPITFQDPSDADLTWDWDDMHMPFALTPLAAEYISTIGGGFNDRYHRFGFPQRWRHAVWNGYAYFTLNPNVPADEVDELGRRWADVCRTRIPVTAAWWRDEALPELRALYDRIRSIPVDDLPPVALMRAWDDAWAAGLRAWEIHFVAILGPYQVMDDLADAYEAAVPEASPGEAMRLIQGTRHKLFEVELGTERLASAAAGWSEVAARLRAEGRPSREDLRTVDGGGEFLAELDAFLAEHGHLGQGFDDLAQPSWSDDPSIFLAELAKRLERPAPSAEARRARLAAEADELVDKARARLASDPEALAVFERTLAFAREIGPLTEVHNYWIDRLAQARLRTFAMRLGQRLVREGVIAERDDVLYLRHQDITGAILAPLDLRGLVADRKAEHARQRRIRPPRSVGKPRDPGGRADRFDGERFASSEADELRGTGASAGVARGPARVTLSSEDFGRIRPGDIIVCPSSNASWVPVFTIAAGLVTNTGGVLSHAAVVAREFGLPAVVGTGDATDRIADGRTVEIDGARGIVRLL